MKLEKLKRDITACTLCKDKGIIPEARPVFQLPSTARIGLFGQAPGNLVHQTGKPFNDPSGKRLRQWMGVSEEEFYDSGKLAIVPMAFCFPGYDGKGKNGKGGDLPPPPLCAGTWREKVMAQIESQLGLVLLVGQYAQKWHLGEAMQPTLTATVQQWETFVQDAEAAGRPVYLPMPHPSWRNTSWLKKNPWFEAETVPWMQKKIRSLIND
jgi:uracil-DNA glycosylase